MRIRTRLLAVAGATLLTAAALAVPSPAYAVNVLANPGFETGTLAPWTCSGNTGSVVSTPVHTGTRALAGAVTSGNHALCTQTVTVRASTAYTLSAWVRGSYVHLGITGGAVTWTPSATSYTELRTTFTTGAAQTSVQVYLHGWYGLGTYHADDVSLDGPGGGPGPGPSPGVPGAPGTPTITGATDTSISLSWAAASGTVTGYRVYEGSTVRASVTGTSASLSGLGRCTSHTYTVAAVNTVGESPRSGPVTGSTTGCTPQPPGRAMAAPYYYNGWGNPPNITTVMQATGIRSITMAFMLSGGGCVPRWDSNRALLGGVDQQTINAVRAAGGDVEISFGGWQGNKLGPNCSTAQALAGAIQQVIDAYNLKFVDLDIENQDELENATVRNRLIDAIKIVKQRNPSVRTIVTIPTFASGLSASGLALVRYAAQIDAQIDNFTIMPFNFDGHADMFGSTVRSTTALKDALRNAFGWTDAQAFARSGISGMNGRSDVGEITTTQIWTQIRDWSNQNHIGRLAFWSVNRDRQCSGSPNDGCSGTPQGNWQFTSITAGFTG